MVYWIPATAAVFFLFGFPVAKAQRLARKGLAGEERGERFVGLVAALTAAGMAAHWMAFSSRFDGWSEVFQHLLLAVASIVPGLTAAFFSNARETSRTAFVARVEAGQISGYRVDATVEGKVLVRISSQGEGYRVAERHDVVVELDREGAAVRRLT